MQAQTISQSSARAPMRMTLSAKRNEGDLPRDCTRMILKVQVAEMDSSVVIEGHKLRGGAVEYIEVYSDRLAAVEACVRRPEHARIVETAKQMARNESAAWITERMHGFRGSEAERTVFRQRLERECPIHWAQKLTALDPSLRGGLPPLLSVEPVGEELPAPPTPETATRDANQALTAAIVQALEASRSRKQ